MYSKSVAPTKKVTITIAVVITTRVIPITSSRIARLEGCATARGPPTYRAAHPHYPPTPLVRCCPHTSTQAAPAQRRHAVPAVDGVEDGAGGSGQALDGQLVYPAAPGWFHAHALCLMGT